MHTNDKSSDSNSRAYPSQERFTPLDLAEMFEKEEVARVFRSHGAKRGTEEEEDKVQVQEEEEAS
jgi:hypothetical protein